MKLFKQIKNGIHTVSLMDAHYICETTSIRLKTLIREREKFKLANNTCARFKAKGTVPFTANVSGTEKTVFFLDTLYVPHLRTNLISVSRITDKGYSVIFDKDQDLVIDEAGNRMFVAERVNDLYYVYGRDDKCRVAAELDILTHIQEPKTNPPNLED